MGARKPPNAKATLLIASVRGPVGAVFIDSAVIDVGGVGIQVFCTPATLAGLRVGDQTTLATSLVVREDSLTLFGFADEDERSLFQLLQTASGVGPKLAQAILAVHGPKELRRSVTSEDLVALCKVPGIGRKGAQRIVLELKDRIGAPARPGHSVDEPVLNRSEAWRGQVKSGLLGLGWSAREADAALDAVQPLADEAEENAVAVPVAELLRAALRFLSRA
jgi:holliday junction DNA helicase RuvA